MVAALDLRDASRAALFIADLLGERPEFFADDVARCSGWLSIWPCVCSVVGGL
jgi:hypothetical protein